MEPAESEPVLETASFVEPAEKEEVPVPSNSETPTAKEQDQPWSVEPKGDQSGYTIDNQWQRLVHSSLSQEFIGVPVAGEKF